MPDLSAPQGRGADEGRLPGLARRAVATVAALELRDVEQIAHRLYCFHRIPWGPHWSRSLPDPALLLASARGWRRPVPVRQAGGWLSLSRPGESDRDTHPRFGYKLYLSPAPAAVAEVLPVAAEVAARAGAVRFKVGADPIGLLRPDKIVFYLRDAVELAELAGALAAALDGAQAHGVPFSAPLTGDGLLSWAGDPPGDERQSWRMAVCQLLAESLSRGVPPAEALLGLADNGVLVPDFAPAALVPPTPLRSAA